MKDRIEIVLVHDHGPSSQYKIILTDSNGKEKIVYHKEGRPVGHFADLIRTSAKDGMNVAEIGVWDGVTTKGYIDTIHKNEGHLYAVDWFKGNIGTRGSHGHLAGPLGPSTPDNSRIILELFKHNISTYLDNITILNGNSHEMINKIPDKSLDICFIDCDHTYASVTKDIELCIPKMKDDSILCGHDCETFNFVDTYSEDDLLLDYIKGKGHPGVQKAVYEKFGSNVQIIPGHIWIVQGADL